MKLILPPLTPFVAKALYVGLGGVSIVTVGIALLILSVPVLVNVTVVILPYVLSSNRPVATSTPPLLASSLSTLAVAVALNVPVPESVTTGFGAPARP